MMIAVARLLGFGWSRPVATAGPANGEPFVYFFTAFAFPGRYGFLNVVRFGIFKQVSGALKQVLSNHKLKRGVIREAAKTSRFRSQNLGIDSVGIQHRTREMGLVFEFVSLDNYQFFRVHDEWAITGLVVYCRLISVILPCYASFSDRRQPDSIVATIRLEINRCFYDRIIHE